MSEKTPGPAGLTNKEQATEALRALYTAASAEVFRVNFLATEDRGQADYAAIQRHKDTLLRFAPELMDDRFSAEVADMVRQCNEILDGPDRAALGI